jgi:hypothetical protein
MIKHSNHPTTKTDANEPARDEVAKNVYALFEKEGHPQAFDKQNWLKADAQSQHAGLGHSHPLSNHQHQSGESVGAI